MHVTSVRVETWFATLPLRVTRNQQVTFEGLNDPLSSISVHDMFLQTPTMGHYFIKVTFDDFFQ